MKIAGIYRKSPNRNQLTHKELHNNNGNILIDSDYLYLEDLSFYPNSFLFDDTQLFVLMHFMPNKEKVDEKHLINQLRKKIVSAIMKEKNWLIAIVYDKTNNTLYLFRDAIGITPVYYHFSANEICFSTYPNAFNKLNLEINIDYLKDTIFNLFSPLNTSFYKKLHILEPGHVLISDRKSSITKQYWYYNNTKYTISSNTIPDFLEKVKNALPVTSKFVGAELSGGLDSSFLTALYSDKKNTIKAYSHVLSKELKKNNQYRFKDDINKINDLLAYNSSIQSQQVISENDGIIDSIKSFAVTHNYIPQSLFGVFSSSMYNLFHQHNTKILLSGFGGDQLVSAHFIGFYNELIHRFKFCTLFDEIKKRKQIRYQNNNPYYESFIHLVRTIPVSDYLYRTIKNKKLKAISKSEINFIPLTSEILEDTDLLQRYIKSNHLKHITSYNDYYLKLLYSPYVARRLEELHAVSNSYNFTYSFPLLNRELIDFFLNLPLDYKCKNGWDRYIVRIAAKDYLPDSIRWNHDKTGNIIPGLLKRITNDKKNITEILHASKNGIMSEFLDMEKLIKLVNNYNIHKETNEVPLRLFLRPIYTTLFMYFLEHQQKNQQG
jgi:asparagine synthase (glutamine-hydrolysing)